MALRWTVGSMVLVAIAWMAAAVPAQSPQTAQAPGGGLLLGRVVDGGTGRPMEDAIVSLGCVGANPPARDRVRSDANGRFVFLQLPPGTHTICGNRPGYTLGAPVRVTLAAGQHIADLVLRLTPVAERGSISGIVVDEHGEPAVGVRLLLLTRNAGGSGPRFWQRGGATTDDRGAFRISPLSPGQYAIMVPSTVIGVPASTLEALRRANSSTTEIRRELSSIGAVSGNLPPPPAGSPERVEIGDSVLPLARLARPPAPGPDGKLLVYPTQFLPGTTSFATATRIDLDDGEVLTGLQMQLRTVAAVRVSGILTGPAGAGANLAVQLVAADPEGLQADLAVAATVTDDDARFVFPAVPAGEYAVRVLKVPRISTLRTTSTTIETPTGSLTVPSTTRATTPPPLPAEPTLWARQPLSVGDQDIEGLNVVLRIGQRVSGRLEFNGTSPRPAAAQLVPLRINIMRPDGRSITGDMAPAISPVSPSARIEENGSFATQGLPSGPYLFAVLTPPAGWFFTGAMLDGRDLSETPMELGANDVDNVVLTFTDRPTGLSGSVRATGGAPASDTYVLAFPADPARWRSYGTISRRIALARTGGDGRYEFRHLPPGDYFVLATGTTLPRDYQAAETLKPLVRAATRVRLTEGGQAVLDLQAVGR